MADVSYISGSGRFSNQTDPSLYLSKTAKLELFVKKEKKLIHSLFFVNAIELQLYEVVNKFECT